MSQFMCGWVDREGQFYKCGEYRHNGLAEEIIDVRDIPYVLHEKYGFLRGESLLDHIGYIKVTQANLFKEDVKYDNGRVYYCSNHRMTKEQKNWIHDNMDNFSHKQLECISRIMEMEG